MRQKHTKAEKQIVIERYLAGQTVNNIVADTSIPRSTVYAWTKQYQDGQSSNKLEISVRNFRLLENKVTRLEGIIEILKSTDCSINAPLKEKLSALELLHGQYSVHMLCEALDVPRGTFYNHIFRNKKDLTWYAKRREEFRLQIQQVYDDSNQIFGAEKIAAVMKNEGYRISVEMVRELMRDMGLVSIREDAKKLYDKERRRYRNYLNQQFNTTKPNQVWVSDVTYFRYNNKNYYICAILDLYARMIVGYKVGKTNSTQLVKSTFISAFKNRSPGTELIFHTDRGANYRSKTFCSYLSSLQITQSYSRSHVPYDNSVMESFFASLKREELYRTKYRSESEFRTAVDNYMEFYNERRPHGKNGYKTPEQKEDAYTSNHADL